MPMSLRSFRLDDKLWQRAMARATHEKVYLSEKIREWLEEYADDDKPHAR